MPSGLWTSFTVSEMTIVCNKNVTMPEHYFYPRCYISVLRDKTRDAKSKEKIRFVLDLKFYEKIISNK